MNMILFPSPEPAPAEESTSFALFAAHEMDCIGWLRDAREEDDRAARLIEAARDAVAEARAARHDDNDTLLAVECLGIAAMLRAKAGTARRNSRRYRFAAQLRQGGATLPEALDWAGLHNPFGRRHAPLPLPLRSDLP